MADQAQEVLVIMSAAFLNTDQQTFGKVTQKEAKARRPFCISELASLPFASLISFPSSHRDAASPL